jgi:U32 family peptidase
MTFMETHGLTGKDLPVPELVAPAGDWSSLSSAVASGADSVYFGVKGLNMRHSARNFDMLELKKIMDFLRSEGRKGYLALNVMIHEGETQKVDRLLDEAASAGVDAVILWDMAVLSLAAKHGLTAHLSTQASVSNFEALKVYNGLGVKRAVLARECSLEGVSDIAARIRESGMDCGIETFIHGAMCVSVSGRCFLSQETFSRSANRGDCLQPCRREYLITDTDTGGECEYVLGRDYVLSAKDLCTVMFLDELILSGINAFKIEGRMRPPEYVGCVTAVYREAIDAFARGELTLDLKKNLFKRLSGSFNRGFTGGFFAGRPNDLGGEPRKNYEKIYIGKVKKYYKKIGVAEITVESRGIKKGDRILISGARTPAAFFEAGRMEVEHKLVESMRPGQDVGVEIPFPVRPADKVFAWEEISR